MSNALAIYKDPSATQILAKVFGPHGWGLLTCPDDELDAFLEERGTAEIDLVFFDNQTICESNRELMEAYAARFLDDGIPVVTFGRVSNWGEVRRLTAEKAMVEIVTSRDLCGLLELLNID